NGTAAGATAIEIDVLPITSMSLLTPNVIDSALEGDLLLFEVATYDQSHNSDWPNPGTITWEFGSQNLISQGKYIDNVNFLHNASIDLSISSNPIQPATYQFNVSFINGIYEQVISITIEIFYRGSSSITSPSIISFGTNFNLTLTPLNVTGGVNLNNSNLLLNMDIPFESSYNSTDGTYDWLIEYKKADCRVTKIFGSNKNIGVEAINNLAEEAKGKYILKVDDDVFVPKNFAKRLICAYEEVNEEKLLFLGWDMAWQDSTFATRSGKKLYRGENGKTIVLSNKDKVLITYHPSKWMINGACRLCKRETFLEIGGHPKGVIYGVDHLISREAEKHGYWVGYLNSKDFVEHVGNTDTTEYRKMKDAQLVKFKCPRHV
ncbi:hypothetical protein LCGC14_2555940, partial [marine sediment metagenome]